MNRRDDRYSATPGRWLIYGACMTVVVYAVAGAAAMGLARRGRTAARVPRWSVTGRAAAALGDSGIFASPLLPLGVQPVLAHADAESAAVAMAYWFAPSYQVAGVPYYQEHPTERRHICGRSYYVRPVMVIPDSVNVTSTGSDVVNLWGATWVMPVCDDAGRARTTVLLADEPTRLHVIQGGEPGDVPELVHPPGNMGRISGADAGRFRDWEQGISLTPETAVIFATTQLAGARVAEIPDAFMVAMSVGRPRSRERTPGAFLQGHACARWRLVLDRSVRLRSVPSGHVASSRVVYVVRGERGCSGALMLQIPKPAQPTTVPFSYLFRPPELRNVVIPPHNGHPGTFPPPEIRWAAWRVTEPLWFEEARLDR
jgi:hypothetical protein